MYTYLKLKILKTLNQISHLAFSTARMYTCDLCKESYVWPQDVQRHSKEKHRQYIPMSESQLGNTIAQDKEHHSVMTCDDSDTAGQQQQNISYEETRGQQQQQNMTYEETRGQKQQQQNMSCEETREQQQQQYMSYEETREQQQQYMSYEETREQQQQQQQQNMSYEETREQQQQQNMSCEETRCQQQQQQQQQQTMSC